MYRVVLTRRARKGLEKSPGHVRRKSVDAIDALQQSFAPVKLFDVKKLQGYDNVFRIRIGNWRIIYELHKDEGLIVILEIGPRGRVY